MKDKIAISYFKAHCLEIINQVNKSNKPVTITKRNKEIAQVLPIKINQQQLFGLLQNQAKIKGNIVSSINETWDADK